MKFLKIDFFRNSLCLKKLRIFASEWNFERSLIFFALTLSIHLSAADIDKLSEAFGHQIVRGLKDFNLNTDGIIQGIKDEVAGKPSPLSDEEYEAQALQLQGQTFLEIAQKNLDESNAFLAKNAKELGVVEVIPGKLQYKVTKNGSGEEVKEQSTPQIYYKGTFVDGTVFGSTEKDEPIPLPLADTIPGFKQGLVSMKEGEQRTLFVHPDLAYGTKGPLPPNKALIFEIEVVKANNPEVE